MAYAGYLLQINAPSGGTTVTGAELTKYMVASSYKAKDNTLDEEAYRDANGVLHRDTLTHVPLTISFQLDGLTDITLEALMSKIRSCYISNIEHKVNVTAYIPRTNSYVTQDMYMPDIEFPIKSVNSSGIEYDAISFELIGY